jgi:hypothetical protein
MRRHAHVLINSSFMTMGDPAVYTPKGASSVDVLIVPDLSHETLDYGDTTMYQAATTFHIRSSDVEVPNQGDRINYDGDFYTVQGEPQYKDARKLVWILNVIQDD